MRKTVLAVMAAGSVFAVTAAGATGLTVSNGTGATVTTTTSGSATISSAQCGAVTADYTYDATGQNLTGIALSSTDADCSGLAATATVNGTAFGTGGTFGTSSPYGASLTGSATMLSGDNTVVVTIAAP